MKIESGSDEKFILGSYKTTYEKKYRDSFTVEPLENMRVLQCGCVYSNGENFKQWIINHRTCPVCEIKLDIDPIECKTANNLNADLREIAEKADELFKANEDLLKENEKLLADNKNKDCRIGALKESIQDSKIYYEEKWDRREIEFSGIMSNMNERVSKLEQQNRTSGNNQLSTTSNQCFLKPFLDGVMQSTKILASSLPCCN